MATKALLQSTAMIMLAEWTTTLSFIFGGCCTNALSLELITAQYPAAGSLITFAQFLLISLIGLRKHLSFGPSRLPPSSRDEIFATIAKAVIQVREADVKSARRQTQLTNKKAERTNVHYRVAIDYTGPDSDAARAGCGAFADDLGERLRREQILSGVIRSSLTTSKDGDIQMSKSQWRPTLSDRTGRKHLDVDDLLVEPRSIDQQQSPLLVTIPDDSVLVLDGNGVLEMPVPEHWWHLTVSLRDVSSKAQQKIQESGTGTPSFAFDVENWSHFYLPQPEVKWPWNWLPHLKSRRVPLKGYLLQVALYYLVSILNNAAFAYNIPMAAHIIFRSGGLVMNMIIGRVFAKRRYTPTQVLSVLLVTVGVFLTTASAIQAKPPRRTHSVSISSSLEAESVSSPPSSILIGIGILTLALVLASVLGLTQDNVMAKYGRGNSDESLFYLHVLALPMFTFVGPDLMQQIRAASAGPITELNLTSLLTSPTQTMMALASPGYSQSTPAIPSPLPHLTHTFPSIRVPALYIPLLINVITQLICTTGVHRLTTHVSSLTVTLVLAVRKAISLAISVLLLGGSQGNAYLWSGALAVLLGTITYTIGGRPPPAPPEQLGKPKQD